MVLASFVGVCAIWRQRDRSPQTIASTFIGLLVIVFLLGEFLAPH